MFSAKVASHMSKRILLVGHCGVDGPRLQSEISSFLGGVEVLRVNSDQDLQREAGQGADLLMVNREPVGFSKEGVDIIRHLHQHFPDCKVMLVSDYPEAQEEALGVGAIPGVGKADIGSPKFEKTVREAVGN